MSVRGVNLGGWYRQVDAIQQKDPERFIDLPTHVSTFLGKGDFTRVATWGFDHVRVPVDDDNVFVGPELHRRSPMSPLTVSIAILACLALACSRRTPPRTDVGVTSLGAPSGLVPAVPSSSSPAAVVATRTEVISRPEHLFIDNPDTCLRTAPTTVRCWGWGPSRSIVTYKDAVYVRGSFIERKDGSWGYKTPMGPLMELASAVSDMNVGGRPEYPVVRVPELEGATTVFGYNHACALVQRRVLCWGTNDLAELGYDSTDTCFFMNQYMPCSLTPKEPRHLGEVAELVVGYGFACARRQQGGVYCWGALGVRGVAKGCVPDEDAGLCRVPVAKRIPAFDTAVAMAASDDSVCVVLRDGTVYCLGPVVDRSSGNTVIRADQPTPIPGVVSAKAVALSSEQACVITVERQVRCIKRLSGAAIAVPNLVDVVEIAVGLRHACALRADRSLWCWGERERMGLDRAGTTDEPIRIVVGESSIHEAREPDAGESKGAP